MTTNGDSKFSYLVIGLGLGAIGGLISAVLARKETRELLRERSNKGPGLPESSGLQIEMQRVC